MLFDIYLDGEYVRGGYKDEQRARSEFDTMVKENHFYLLAGGKDGLNTWGAYKAISTTSGSSYHILAIKKSNYDPSFSPSPLYYDDTIELSEERE